MQVATLLFYLFISSAVISFSLVWKKDDDSRPSSIQLLVRIGCAAFHICYSFKFLKRVLLEFRRRVVRFVLSESCAPQCIFILSATLVNILHPRNRPANPAAFPIKCSNACITCLSLPLTIYRRVTLSETIKKWSHPGFECRIKRTYQEVNRNIFSYRRYVPHLNLWTMIPMKHLHSHIYAAHPWYYKIKLLSIYQRTTVCQISRKIFSYFFE